MEGVDATGSSSISSDQKGRMEVVDAIGISASNEKGRMEVVDATEISTSDEQGRMEGVDPEFGLTYDNFVKKFKQWMKDNALSQRMVAPALCVSQGHLCDLLAQNKVTSWKMITKEGRKPYLRMAMLMNDEMTLGALCRNPKLFSGEDVPLRCHQNGNMKLKKSSRFTPYQKQTLEKAFQLSNYPMKPAYQGIAEAVGLSHEQVRTWFNNRRKLRPHGASIKQSEHKENKGDSAKLSIKVRNGKICATSGWSPNQLEMTSSLNLQESVVIPGVGVLLDADVSGCQRFTANSVVADAVDGASCVEQVDLHGIDDSLVVDPSTSSGNPPQEQATYQSGKVQNIVTAAANVTTGLSCVDKQQFLSVQEIVELIKASSSGEGFPGVVPSMSTDKASSGIQLNSTTICTEDEANVVVEDESESSHDGSLKPEDDNLSRYTETQLKFLRLAYEVHKFPSEDVIEALHVLTSIEKKDIQDWFFEETLRNPFLQ